METWICAGCGKSQDMDQMAWLYFGSFYCDEKCLKRNKSAMP